MKDIIIGSVITDGEKEYTIKNRIGSGGFAVVYKAVADGTTYAVKVLNSADQFSITSIRNEFDIASKVMSEHAVRYFYLNEYGHNDYPCFIIMEYAGGGTLDKELQNRVDSGNPYTTEEVHNIFTQLIDGMIDISNVAVHRDIKPQNILVSEGIYKISDYGIAKYANEETRSASKTMKGAYSDLFYAPELWADPSAHGNNDTKVDIYAMGIVFYMIANLRYPYDIIDDYRFMHMTSAINPFNRDVDPAYESLIRKMMEKSKAKRFNSWAQIKEFIDNSSVGAGVKRDSFVENMLKNSLSKQQAVDARLSKENQENQERIDRFRRLVYQIENEIYNPLKAIVDAFNKDSIKQKAGLSEIKIDDEDEEFSFEYVIDPLEEDDDEKNISFSFATKHPETIEVDYKSVSNNYGGMPIGYGFPRERIKQTFEYKYDKNRILLWGNIEADCGSCVNVAIIETADDELYGDLKSFLRTANITNAFTGWLPIDSEKLRSLCQTGFYEMQYTTKVEEFDFELIKTLMTQNEMWDYGTVRDPFEGGTFLY